MIERRRSLRNDSAYVLAVMILLGFFGIAFLVLLREVPKDSQPIAQGILTATQMMLSGVVGFFYGASKTALEQRQPSAAENSVTTDIATHFSSTMPDQPKEP